MLQKKWKWVKRVFNRMNSVLTLSRSNPTFSEVQSSIAEINKKINLLLTTKKHYVNFSAYEKYFDFLSELGLREDFEINTTQDKIVLRGTSLRPLLLNSHNQKVLIFCHGVTNNRWSLFYCMHLALQIGYQVVTYDARNHGLSEKSYTSLGQVEASDLQDIINYVQKKYCPKKIGLYGFSMGAATCLFWISYFASQEKNSSAAMAICEAPFDNFSRQWKFTLGGKENYYLKEYFASQIVQRSLRVFLADLAKVNPLDALPSLLPLKLLLIHGLEDSIINWKASWRIWNKLQKNPANQKKVNLYFCRSADHGETPFIGDCLPQPLLQKNKKISKFTFSTLFINYLRKNL